MQLFFCTTEKKKKSLGFGSVGWELAALFSFRGPNFCSLDPGTGDRLLDSPRELLETIGHHSLCIVYFFVLFALRNIGILLLGRGTDKEKKVASMMGECFHVNNVGCDLEKEARTDGGSAYSKFSPWAKLKADGKIGMCRTSWATEFVSFLQDGGNPWTRMHLYLFKSWERKTEAAPTWPGRTRQYHAICIDSDTYNSECSIQTCIASIQTVSRFSWK